MSRIINANTHFLNSQGEVEAIPSYITERRFNEPLCSVIITSFNYGHFLQYSAESVLAQTFPSLELIIVDDSTDPNSQEIVRTYIGKPRVQVIFKHNRGVCSARNTGIAAAQGKYVCCLDADDILHPNYIEQCIFELESHDNVGFASSWVQNFGNSNAIWETLNTRIEVCMRANTTCIAAVFRKADWQLINGYNSSMQNGNEDWEIWLRLMQLGRSGKVIPIPLFLYRIHNKSNTARVQSMLAELEQQVRDLNPKLFSDPFWFETVRKYTSVISESHYPQKLAELVSKNIASQERETLLVIISFIKFDESDLFMFNIIKKLSSSYELTLVVVSNIPNIEPLKNYFTPVAKNIFQYANPTPDDFNHFAHFISYIIQTRHIKMVLNSGCFLFYESLAAIKNQFVDLAVMDVLNNEDAKNLRFSINQTPFINHHVCLSEKIKKTLIESNIQNQKIAVLT